MFSLHPNHPNIIKTLESQFIHPKNGLTATYQQLTKYTKERKAADILPATIFDFQEPLKSFLIANQDQLTTLAIDLPVYYQAQIPTSKTLMICAMDPLPPIPTSPFWKDKTIRFNEDVGFWAPFSLIDNWDEPTGSMRSNLPFFKTLLKHVNIYVTDVYKLFFRFQQQNGWLNSNAISTYTLLKNSNGVSIHGALLAKEIEYIQPSAIVTLGNASRNNLLAMNEIVNAIHQAPVKWSDNLQKYYWNKDRLILASPHISGAANGAKAAILSNPSFQQITGNYQNERLAKIIVDQLSLS